MKFLAQALLLASLATIPALAATDDLVSNGGFEAGNAGWGLYVPDESKDKNCRFDVVGDGGRVRGGRRGLNHRAGFSNSSRIAASRRPHPPAPLPRPVVPWEVLPRRPGQRGGRREEGATPSPPLSGPAPLAACFQNGTGRARERGVGG